MLLVHQQYYTYCIVCIGRSKVLNLQQQQQCTTTAITNNSSNSAAAVQQIYFAKTKYVTISNLSFPLPCKRVVMIEMYKKYIGIPLFNKLHNLWYCLFCKQCRIISSLLIIVKEIQSEMEMVIYSPSCHSKTMTFSYVENNSIYKIKQCSSVLFLYTKISSKYVRQDNIGHKRLGWH